MTTCAVLLSTYFAGMQIADLDRSRVYEIPASIMDQMSVTQRITAKACALRHGIRYTVKKAGASNPAEG